MRKLEEVTVNLTGANSSCCYLSYFVQYQNVFAPLIKLEADYDKVCLMTFGIISIFYGYTSIATSYRLTFVIDDERISKQG